MTDGLQYLIGSSIYITSAAQFTGIVEYGFLFAWMDFQLIVSYERLQVFGVVHDFDGKVIVFLKSFITDGTGGYQYFSTGIF